MTKLKKLGEVKITFDGPLLESVEFHPNKMSLDAQILKNLKNVHLDRNDVDEVKEVADTMLAQFFASLSEIEIVDRNEMQITSTIDKQDRVYSCCYTVTYNIEKVPPILKAQIAANKAKKKSTQASS